MADTNHPHFAYHNDAYSYVERAKKQLELFDTGNPESLFYAAFELRTGIEARLYDGLRAKHGQDLLYLSGEFSRLTQAHCLTAQAERRPERSEEASAPASVRQRACR
jgi:hypothetical protein